jgi:hypothetical protein
MRAGLTAGRYRRVLLEVHPSLLAGRGVAVRDVLAPLAAAGYQAWRIDHSPGAARRAAYARRVDPRAFLHPTSADEAVDSLWPHYLWVHPGDAAAIA